MIVLQQPRRACPAQLVLNTSRLLRLQVSELKMSMRSMGMFEGLLEAFSYVVRMCSGR